MNSHIRKQFPQLNKKVGNYPLVYLDNAATTLKPQVVIDRMTQYYSGEVSNVHRGAHYFSNLATENFEKTRHSTARFLNSSPEEIIFTSGTTDSINLVAYSLQKLIDQNKEKNEIVLSEMEHHSNIVPWYFLAKKNNFKIKTIPFDKKGDLDLTNLDQLINDKTLICSVVHMSNTFGTINPIEEIVNKCKGVGALSFIDAAQSVSFLNLDVKKINCDFLTFSSHKLFGPEGLGLLYIKKDISDQLGFFKGGGSMIADVDFENISFLSAPNKYEAGTPSIGSVIAFDEALKFFSSINLLDLQNHEKELLDWTWDQLADLKGFEPLGHKDNKKNILSLNFKGIHSSDLGALLDQMGVAIRVGHHCTQPLMKKLNLNGSLRASFSIYNDKSDCESFVSAVKKAKELLDD